MVNRETEGSVKVKHLRQRTSAWLEVVNDFLSLLQLASMCFPQGVCIHVCTCWYDDLDE